MVEELVNLLIEKKYKISVAESCTGGLLASEIVSVSNASKVLDISFVTYANEAKVKYLGVRESMINQFGVVSEAVVKDMAYGLYQQTKANLTISTSGIAGPGGGCREKPVGMVCFGICLNGKIYTYTKYFDNQGRNYIRQEAVKFIINEATRLLKDNIKN